MADDVLKTARETLALAEKADRTPLIVNRHDTVAGGIGWQLQQDGGRGEVVGEIIDLDVPRAKGTAFYLAHAHNAAPELARFAVLVDEMTRDWLRQYAAKQERVGTNGDEARAISAEAACVILRDLRARLGLETP